MTQLTFPGNVIPAPPTQQITVQMAEVEQLRRALLLAVRRLEKLMAEASH